MSVKSVWYYGYVTDIVRKKYDMGVSQTMQENLTKGICPILWCGQNYVEEHHEEFCANRYICLQWVIYSYNAVYQWHGKQKLINSNYGSPQASCNTSRGRGGQSENGDVAGDMIM